MAWFLWILNIFTFCQITLLTPAPPFIFLKYDLRVEHLISPNLAERTHVPIFSVYEGHLSSSVISHLLGNDCINVLSTETICIFDQNFLWQFWSAPLTDTGCLWDDVRDFFHLVVCLFFYVLPNSIWNCVLTRWFAYVGPRPSSFRWYLDLLHISMFFVAKLLNSPVCLIETLFQQMLLSSWFYTIITISPHEFVVYPEANKQTHSIVANVNVWTVIYSHFEL